MNAIALRTDNAVAFSDGIVSGLPALVRKAAAQLAAATTAAEVLDAKAMAGVAYDAAKSAARFAKAKGAYDDVIGAVYRAQADALEIEAMAKRRLADEYDAAQERGEVRGLGGDHGNQHTGGKVPVKNSASYNDIGLSKGDVHDARRTRDAINDNPEIIAQSLEAILDRGHEPTKAALGREINTRLSSFSGDNEWYTPARYIDMARDVMGSIDVDPASNEFAQRTVKATTHYTVENSSLDKEWNGTVWMNPPYSNPEIQQFTDKVITEYTAGRTTEAIVLTNNAADTGWHHALQAACTCMCTVKGRIRFESPTRQGNSPAMGQSFFYFGNDHERFKDFFSEIGNVWVLA